MADDPIPPRQPVIQPLGDRGLLVRFADTLSDEANRAAIALAQRLERDVPPGVMEIVPNLVSVLLRYDPAQVRFEHLAGEVRLRLSGAPVASVAPGTHRIPVLFGGDEGPDLVSLAALLGLTPDALVERHCASPLRVLATGFAPGFVYCGFHAEELSVPRRADVRRSVPAGSVLFAARQTAVTATAIPTGWHVIGRTSFSNFDPVAEPPTTLRAGDLIRFEALP